MIKKKSAGWFADYVKLVARRYGDRVKRWATFNEFWVFTIFGYGCGQYALGDSACTVHLQKAVHYVNLSHGAGVDVLRAHVPHASIGAIHNYFFFSSRRRHTRCLSDWSSDVCSSD